MSRVDYDIFTRGSLLHIRGLRVELRSSRFQLIIIRLFNVGESADKGYFTDARRRLLGILLINIFSARVKSSFTCRQPIRAHGG